MIFGRRRRSLTNSIPETARRRAASTALSVFRDVSTARAEVARVCRDEAVDQQLALNRVMTLGVMSLAADLPVVLRPAFMRASDCWLLGVDHAEQLDQDLSDCWQFLDDKHGTSTDILDAEDVAVRALICIAGHADWDDQFSMDMLDFFIDLVHWSVTPPRDA